MVCELCHECASALAPIMCSIVMFSPCHPGWQRLSGVETCKYHVHQLVAHAMRTQALPLLVVCLVLTLPFGIMII